MEYKCIACVATFPDGSQRFAHEEKCLTMAQVEIQRALVVDREMARLAAREKSGHA